MGESIPELNVDEAIIREPSRGQHNVIWFIDKSGKCGIWATGRYPFEETTATGFIRAKSNSVHIYVDTLRQARQAWNKNELMLDASVRFPLVITRHLNAWSTVWGNKVAESFFCSYIILSK